MLVPQVERVTHDTSYLQHNVGTVRLVTLGKNVAFFRSPSAHPKKITFRQLAYRPAGADSVWFFVRTGGPYPLARSPRCPHTGGAGRSTRHWCDSCRLTLHHAHSGLGGSNHARLM